MANIQTLTKRMYDQHNMDFVNKMCISHRKYSTLTKRMCDSQDNKFELLNLLGHIGNFPCMGNFILMKNIPMG